MKVHETIISQLGGKKIFAMAFSKAVYSTDWLLLVLARGLQNHKGPGKKITHVRVTLEPTDTYKVEFLYVPSRGARSGMETVLRSVDDVYADSLKTLVERETGLYLSL